MLVFDATKRISVDDALWHPFLAALTREYSRFPVTDPFNYDYEKRRETKKGIMRSYGEEIPLEDLRILFLQEAVLYPVSNFHYRSLRTQPGRRGSRDMNAVRGPTADHSAETTGEPAADGR